MKNFKTSILTIFLTLSLVFITLFSNAQTAGNLTFSCSTSAPNGNWGTKHVVAIWIENSNNAFVKTNAKYGHDDDHLTTWKASSNGNKVDAVTGATVSSYRTESVIWDGTDVSRVVVEDGTYNVFIEMGWGKDKTNDHAVVSFSFTKGTEGVQVTPSDKTNFSNVSLAWEPTLTAISQASDQKSIAIYPNPSHGIITLDIKKPFVNAKIVVENIEGKSVYQESLANDFTGIKTVDLRSYNTGLYFVKIVAQNQQFVYKVLVN